MRQQSPIIFWLLLAATISIDALVLCWVAVDRFASGGLHTTLYYALVISQLSIVSIWSALRKTPSMWTRAAPLVAAAIASFTTAGLPLPLSFRGLFAVWNYFGYFCLHVLILLATLWLLQRTNFWQRTTGDNRSWQFSLAHLLIVTTLAGIITTVVRNNVFLADEPANIVEAICCILLAVASVVLWSFSWNWPLRLAGLLFVASLLAVVKQAIFFGPMIFRSFEVFFILYPFYLIQAIVLSIWLGIGPILPSTADDLSAVADEARPSLS